MVDNAHNRDDRSVHVALCALGHCGRNALGGGRGIIRSVGVAAVGLAEGGDLLLGFSDSGGRDLHQLAYDLIRHSRALLASDASQADEDITNRVPGIVKIDHGAHRLVGGYGVNGRSGGGKRVRQYYIRGSVAAGDLHQSVDSVIILLVLPDARLGILLFVQITDAVVTKSEGCDLSELGRQIATHVVGAPCYIQSRKIGKEALPILQVIGNELLPVARILPAVENGAVSWLNAEFLQQRNAPGQIPAPSARNYILAPLGVIEISVGILKPVYEFRHRLLHKVGDRIKVRAATLVAHTRAFPEIQSLVSALRVGQEALVISGGLGIVVSARPRIVKPREPIDDVVVVNRVELLHRLDDLASLRAADALLEPLPIRCAHFFSVFYVIHFIFLLK